MNIDHIYRLGICLEASKLQIAAAKRGNVSPAVRHYAREAQAARRELREIV